MQCISHEGSILYTYLSTSLSNIFKRGGDDGMKGFHLDKLQSGLGIKITLIALKDNGIYPRTTQVPNKFITRPMMTSGPSK
jgi:hypothetical protein